MCSVEFPPPLLSRDGSLFLLFVPLVSLVLFAPSICVSLSLCLASLSSSTVRRRRGASIRMNTRPEGRPTARHSRRRVRASNQSIDQCLFSTLRSLISPPLSLGKRDTSSSSTHHDIEERTLPRDATLRAVKEGSSSRESETDVYFLSSFFPRRKNEETNSESKEKKAWAVQWLSKAAALLLLLQQQQPLLLLPLGETKPHPRVDVAAMSASPPKQKRKRERSGDGVGDGRRPRRIPPDLHHPHLLAPGLPPSSPATPPGSAPTPGPSPRSSPRSRPRPG